MPNGMLNKGRQRLVKSHEDDPAAIAAAPPPQVAPEPAIIPASENTAQIGSANAAPPESPTASIDAAIAAIPTGSERGGRKSSVKAGKKARGKGRRPRRVGRPRGPERIAITVRILTETDERLTAAVEQTGNNPQTILDAALDAYLTQLGIPGR